MRLLLQIWTQIHEWMVNTGILGILYQINIFAQKFIPRKEILQTILYSVHALAESNIITIHRWKQQYSIHDRSHAKTISIASQNNIWRVRQNTRGRDNMVRAKNI